MENTQDLIRTAAEAHGPCMDFYWHGWESFMHHQPFDLGALAHKTDLARDKDPKVQARLISDEIHGDIDLLAAYTRGYNSVPHTS